jgi:type II secretion system protein I
VSRNPKNPNYAAIRPPGASIKTTATPSTNSFSKRFQGFVLWEILLALTIFCVVAVALITAVHQTVDASILLRDESQVRLELQNLLTETAATKMKPGKSEVQLGDGRVHYEKEIRAVQAKTAAGVVLPSLYEIIVQASWKASGQQRSSHAEVIVYQP